MYNEYNEKTKIYSELRYPSLENSPKEY